MEEGDDESMFNLRNEKFDIGKRRMSRHLSSRSNKKHRSSISEIRGGISSNQGINIYNLRRSENKK